MECHHGTPYCFGIPHDAVTFLTVTNSRDANGDLEVFIDNRKTKSVISFLDEGQYILCNDRALQIGAPYCDFRGCRQTHICSCENNSTTNKVFPAHCNTNDLGNWSLVEHSKVLKPCNNCLYEWLGFHNIDESARRHDLQLLRAPRTLFATLQIDRIAMVYDDILSLDHFWDNFTHTDLPSDLQHCPSHIMTWMLEAWHDFLNQYKYTFEDRFIGFDESPNSTTGWDWDDCGSPADVVSPESEYTAFDLIDNIGEEAFNATEAPEQFDLFDDIILDEFPRIHKKLTATMNELEPTLTYEDPGSNMDELEPNDIPISFVIPKKGMQLAQLL